MDAGLTAGALLVAHVNRRGRIVAHEHDGKAGYDAVARLEGGHCLRRLGADLLRDCVPVDDDRGHVPPLGVAYGVLGGMLAHARARNNGAARRGPFEVRSW